MVLLSWQPVSCHANVAPLGIIVPLYNKLFRRRLRSFSGGHGAARQAERRRKRILDEAKNSSKKRLTNRKGYAILQSLKRTPVEPTEERKTSACKCYGAYTGSYFDNSRVESRTATGRFRSNNARCLQFLSILRTSQATTCFGLDRNLL